MQYKKGIQLLSAATVLAGGFLFAPNQGLAQDPQDDAAFTCSSAVNVMDCIKQTGVGATKPADITAIPVNSQALGFTGPITAGLRYDNYLAWILDVGYAQQFYDAAAAFKLSAGLNERRANVTLGYAITPKQQIKLTYEYLSQNLPFDYASGTVNEWVNQNAFGAAYRYMLDYGILRALEVYGTYTKAGSKELSEVEMYTDNLLTQINYRRIAGGTEKTAGATFTLTPFKSTIVKVGGGYSTLNFDTQWENIEDTSALVYNAEISHLLTPTTLISTGIGNTASGRTHTAKVSQILPWSLEASLIGQYTATTNDIPSSTSVTASLSYPAPKTYTNMFAAGIGKLKDWVEKPVLYQSRVLARAEEKIVQVSIKFLSEQNVAFPPIPVGTGLTANNGIKTKDYFSYSEGVYDKIEYHILSIDTPDGNPIPANLNNLNLVVAPQNSFESIVSSAAPTTQAMIPNGQNVIYTLTLQAQGYRKGAIVTKTNGKFNITVTPNNALKPAQWVNTAALPNAIPGETYTVNPIPLNTPQFIKLMNPSLASESFHFTLDNSKATWVKLSSDDPRAVNQSLVANGKVPSSLQPGSTTITLTAISQASGAYATASPNGTAQVYTITIGATLVLPTWTNAPKLPNATQGQLYNSLFLNPSLTGSGTATYLNKILLNGKPEDDFDMTFQVDQDKTTCKWLQTTADGKALTSGASSVPLDAPSGPCTVYLNVISPLYTNNLPQPINATTIQVNAAQPLAWTNAQVPSPTKINQTYTQNLNTSTYINSPGEDVTFTCSEGCTNGNQLPIKGLTLTPQGLISGAPSNPAQIGAPAAFSVTATNQVNSTAKSFTLQVIKDDAAAAPAWSGKTAWPTAYTAVNNQQQAYDAPLKDYFYSTNPNDIIDYQITQNNYCGSWLKVGVSNSESALVNNGNITTPTPDCQIIVTATSEVSGRSTASAAIKLPVVAGGLVWSSNAFPQVYYLSPDLSGPPPVGSAPSVNNKPIDLRNYITNAASGTTVTFTATDAQGNPTTLPQGLVLESPYIKAIETTSPSYSGPANLNDVNQTRSITLTATSSDANVAPSTQVLSIRISENSALLPRPTVAWNAGTLPNAYTGFVYRDSSNNIIDTSKWLTLNAAFNDQIDYYGVSWGTNCVDPANPQNTWLSMETTTGRITSTTTVPVLPAPANPCILVEAVHIKGSAQWVSSPNLSIPVIQGPTWVKSTLPTPFPQYWGNTYNAPIYANNPNPDLNYIISYPPPPVGIVPVIRIFEGPDWATITTSAPYTLTVNPKNNELLNAVKATCDATDTITLQAGDQTGYSTQTFPLCIQQNPSLILPSGFKTPLPSAVYNQPYFVSIDPNGGTNCENPDTTYLWQTKTSQGTYVCDKYSNYQIINATGCDWLSIDPNTGELTGTNMNSTYDCEFSIKATSKASGNTFTASGGRIITGQAPVYKTTTASIIFDVAKDDTSRSINLNNLINPEAIITGLNFTFDANDANKYIDSTGNWEISKNNGVFYLSRRADPSKVNVDNKPTFDASLFTSGTTAPTENVTIYVQNVLGSTNQANSTLAITLHQDPNLQMCFSPTISSAQLTAVATVQNNDRNIPIYISPTSSNAYQTNLLYSCDNKGNAVRGDTITMDYFNGSSKSGNPTVIPSTSNNGGQNSNQWIAYINGNASGQEYRLMIPASILNNDKDPGVYDGTYSGTIYPPQLHNLISSAKGSFGTWTMPIKITIYAAVKFINSSFNADIPFHAVNGTPGGINLGEYVATNSDPNWNNWIFTFSNGSTSSGNFEIIGTWIARKQSTSSFIPVNLIPSQRYVEAGDVNTTPVLSIRVQEANSNLAPSTATFNVTVKPGSANNVRFLFNPTAYSNQSFKSWGSFPFYTQSSTFYNNDLFSVVTLNGVDYAIANDHITMDHFSNYAEYNPIKYGDPVVLPSQCNTINNSGIAYIVSFDGYSGFNLVVNTGCPNDIGTYSASTTPSPQFHNLCSRARGDTTNCGNTQTFDGVTIEITH